MSQKKQNLTWYILAAMIIGAVVGQFIHIYYPESIQIKDASGEIKTIARAEQIGQYFKILTSVFLRLVQMIIAPLVITTLIVGIAKMGNLKAVGRVGGRSMLWFFSASLASLLLGLMLVNFFEPGAALKLNINNFDTSSASDVIGKTQAFSIQHFVEHLFPKSLFEALATNEILQIVVFSIFFGVALTQYGEKGDGIVKMLDNLSKIILILVGYVMWFAPLGVFGGITAIIATKGLGILKVYGYYMASFYVGLALLWALLLFVGYLILKKRLGTLLNHLKTPLMVAFSTTSSEAVFPKLTEELEKFGCRKKNRQFHSSLGLQLQPRWIHDVHDLRFHLHRTSLWHPPGFGHPTHHAVGAHAYIQRDCRCSKGIVGSGCSHLHHVQYPRRRHRPDTTHRSFLRYGPINDQRFGKWIGYIGHRQMGKRRITC